MPRPSSPLYAKASVRSPFAFDRSQQNPCAVASPTGKKCRSAHAWTLIICQTMSSRVRPNKHEQPGRTFPLQFQCNRTRGPGANVFPFRETPATRWWSQTGSNRRPHACKARALPTELWPRSVYLGVVGPGRLELPTLRLSGVRSNHLSYVPMAATARPETQARDRASINAGRMPVSR